VSLSYIFFGDNAHVYTHSYSRETKMKQNEKNILGKGNMNFIYLGNDIRDGSVTQSLKKKIPKTVIVFLHETTNNSVSYIIS
jgi:hypothetical protein